MNTANANPDSVDFDTLRPRSSAIARIRNSDRESWEQIYDTFGDRVFAYFLRASEDSDLAADLTHDTFVIVAERGHQLRGNDVAPWLFRIARNLFLEHTRRETRRVKHIRGLDPNRTERRPPVEDALAVREAVAELPMEQQLVVLLYHVDGYSHTEIAEMLDIAVGTSKARLSRARATLREKLER